MCNFQLGVDITKSKQLMDCIYVGLSSSWQLEVFAYSSCMDLQTTLFPEPIIRREGDKGGNDISVFIAIIVF